MSTQLEEFDFGAEVDEEMVLLSGGCPNCGEPGEDVEDTWCRSCGYYARLGTTVELDQQWENLGASIDDDSEGPAIPAWTYKLVGIWFSVLTISSIARATLPAYPFAHMVYGLTQVLGGAALFISIHFSCFFQRSLSDAGVKLMDLLSPFTIWGPVFRELPKTERKLTLGWAGLWAAVFGLAITGGIPTSWLEFKETVVPEKKEEKKKGGPPAAAGTGNLTDAVKDFAEQGTGMVNMPGEPVGAGVRPVFEEEPEEELEEIECVIVGYLPAAPTAKPETAETSEDASEETTDQDEPGDEPAEEADEDPADEPADDEQGADATDAEPPGIRALIVATQVHRRMCVVGYVTEGITEDVAAELAAKFKPHLRDEPYVPCAAAGVWIEPKFVCKILYKEWDAKVGLIEPRFDSVLQELP